VININKFLIIKTVVSYVVSNLHLKVFIIDFSLAWYIPACPIVLPSTSSVSLGTSDSAVVSSLRFTIKSICSSGCCSISDVNSSQDVTELPSTCVTSSPCCKPASSAGLPSCTSPNNAFSEGTP